MGDRDFAPQRSSQHVTGPADRQHVRWYSAIPGPLQQCDCPWSERYPPPCKHECEHHIISDPTQQLTCSYPCKYHNSKVQGCSCCQDGHSPCSLLKGS